MEIWKQYRDTNYEVSNLGNVRNLKTKKIKNLHKKHYGKYENDYIRASLYLYGKDKIVSVHRMVAECFLKDYNESLEVNHKNGIRYDNRVENLEMTTKEENYQHSIVYGNGSQRKPVYAITNNKEKIEFESLWAAARFIKEEMNKSITIDHICNNIKQNIKGICKNAYGYQWFWG